MFCYRLVKSMQVPVCWRVHAWLSIHLSWVYHNCSCTSTSNYCVNWRSQLSSNCSLCGWQFTTYSTSSTPRRHKTSRLFWKTAYYWEKVPTVLSKIPIPKDASREKCNKNTVAASCRHNTEDWSQLDFVLTYKKTSYEGYLCLSILWLSLCLIILRFILTEIIYMCSSNSFVY